ncbi:MAG TPA: hypothetical protein VIL27_00995, partial [Clostridia bacterium]
MIVEFVQDGQTYPGTLLYKAGVATGGGSTGSSQADSLFSMAGSATSLTEPMLEIEFSVTGYRQGDLLIGFPIDARIRIATVEDTVMIPSEAMKKELGEYFVFIMDTDGILHKTFLETGIQSDTHAQVISGLQTGDRVVLNPSSSLADGLRVREKTVSP